MSDRGVVIRGEGGYTVELPSIGLGTMRTSATYAALLIQLEGCRQDQISVLSSVMSELGIDPCEVEHERRQPDCADEAEYSLWREQADRLAERTKRAHNE